MLKKIINNPIWGERLADGVASYIRFTTNKSKFIYEPAEMHDHFRAHDPFILSVWHGQFLLIPTIRPEDIKGTIVVGRHGDAELAAKVVRRFGVTPIRGSGAGGRRVGGNRGGAKVLREALKALKQGSCIVSTADVPPGPAQKVGEGIITMARLSGRPIIPAAIATKNAVTFKTWSRLTINLPFSKAALVAGEPIHIAKNLSDEDAEQVRRTLEQEMDKVTKRAYELVGRSPKQIAPLWQRPKEAGLLLKSYQLATSLAKPFAPLILKRRLARGKEIKERLNERYGLSQTARPTGKLFWFHAASVGETIAIRPLIENLINNHQGLTILLTTGTTTSAKLAAKILPERCIHQFIPLDNKHFIRSFLNHWQPDLAAFVESEIWPNLVLEIKAQEIPLILLNGRMSKRSFKRWFKTPKMARPLIGSFDKILAQSPTDAAHFIALGNENVRNTGNLKADAPPLSVDEEKQQKLRTAIAGRPLLLAASTHKGEETIIKEAHKLISQKHPNLLTIIAPRHPERAQTILESLQEDGLKIEIRNHSSKDRNEPKNPSPDCNIYIANSIGELGLFYSLAAVTFIGGSLVPHGGQNPIEAINFGTAVLSGPHVRNFAPFYHELFIRGGAKRIDTAEELANISIDLLSNPSQHKEMQTNAEASLTFLKGALEKTQKELESYL